jgi:hypothetical protein
MAIQLSVSLGSSFAEFALLESERPRRSLAFQRCYLPSEPLVTNLRQFLAKNSQYKPAKALVSSRRLEKILDTRLGGSVAQIVTKGFENWPLLRQPIANPHFDIFPSRGEPLASQDLIFGVKERMGSEGQVIQGLDLEQLQEVSAQLKLLNVQRVCVNFLFANKNQEHWKQACDFFQQQGFLVFSSPTIGNDEMLTWRKNLLNASLYGTFQESKESVELGCEGTIEKKQIFFLTGTDLVSDTNWQNLSGTLFGLTKALADFYRANAQPVLYLGFEKWFWINPQKTEIAWDSPWGLLAEKRPNSVPMRIQPTQAVVLNELGDIILSETELGYEPGPMVMGRAHKPTVMDLLVQQTKLEQPWVSQNGLQKYLETMKAMLRNSRLLSDNSVDQLNSGLFERMINQLSLQAQVLSCGRNLLVTGALAQNLIAPLKKSFGDGIELCPFSSEVETLATSEVQAE